VTLFPDRGIFRADFGQIKKCRMHKQKNAEISRLAALQHSLPERMRVAARTVAQAERHLAEVLTLRAAGQEFTRSEIAGARMALDRAVRDAEDLQRIQAALPEMLERQQGRSVRLVPV
jgi:hypothetical protein